MRVKADSKVYDKVTGNHEWLVLCIDSGVCISWCHCLAPVKMPTCHDC